MNLTHKHISHKLVRYILQLIISCFASMKSMLKLAYANESDYIYHMLPDLNLLLMISRNQRDLLSIEISALKLKEIDSEI